MTLSEGKKHIRRVKFDKKAHAMYVLTSNKYVWNGSLIVSRRDKKKNLSGLSFIYLAKSMDVWSEEKLAERYGKRKSKGGAIFYGL